MNNKNNYLIFKTISQNLKVCALTNKGRGKLASLQAKTTELGSKSISK